MSETIEDLVLRLATERGAGKTISPAEAAKAAAEQRGEEDWQGRLGGVKAAATRLARRGRLAIYRKGKPVDPETFKGVYRIGLPPEGAGDEPEQIESPAPTTIGDDGVTNPPTDP
ncbi:DUF3253 domain-containing protein [Hansschlegelia beijingensis]|uniref:DUF3253 domain-containing protein n=1 Tax=Hansschlegelia beijingensis TaxID=1133344 RepID=A0A7W6GDR7_9HYPH|nr:DUF3253 domain-containing protein [Hansschlegelia beijingensis]MBB3972076.1 hypothetical protein [Hansschlegelia beijingensis]